MSLFLNASPKLNLRGVEDASGGVEPTVQLDRPQHFPLVYFFSPKGKTQLQFISPENFSLVYGADALDPKGDYAQHTLPLIELLAKNGNMFAAQRLIPPNASTASLRLSIDLLGPYPKPQYQRNSDGSIKTVNGVPVATGEFKQGYTLKFVKSDVTIDEDTGESTFGVATQSQGTQIATVGATTIQSTRYPLVDVLPPDFGGDGNNRGLAIWPVSELDDEPLGTSVLSDQKAMCYPFRIAQVARTSARETGKVIRTKWNEDYLELTFKPKAHNSRTAQDISLAKNWLARYQTVNDPSVPKIYGNFEKVSVYDANLETVLEMLMAAELDADPEVNVEFVGFEDQVHLFNFIGGTNLEGRPYNTYDVNTTDDDAIILSRNTFHYMVGGSDGDMSRDTFNAAVGEAIQEWYNPMSPYMEVLKYPVRWFHDTGYPLDIKRLIIPIIGQRKDILLSLTPHTVGEPKLTASQESSRAALLQTLVRMYPESSYFATSACRAFIMGRSGTKTDTQYKSDDSDGDLPVLLEILDWISAMMGAGHGRWKDDKVPDTNPNNVIKTFIDINATFVPGSTQTLDWESGLNWVAAYDTLQYYVPSLQTVYPDDTSILNSIFAAAACAEIEYAGARVHSNWSGSVKLTQAEFIDAVTKDFTKQLDRKFAGLFNTIVETIIDEGDQQRGYSWHNLVRIQGDPARTVMTLAIRAERREVATA